MNPWGETYECAFCGTPYVTEDDARECAGDDLAAEAADQYVHGPTYVEGVVDEIGDFLS